MKTPPGDSVAGTRLIEHLPPPNTKRWVVRRKAAVVAAVRSGGITVEEACRVYQLSEEEFLSWDRAFELMALLAYALLAFSSIAALALHNPPPGAQQRLSRALRWATLHSF